ncbi:MAG: 30S ribosome-binding factor RbfA [Candidatus Aceula lacicola]|nr:30S ribosome-binding factor RbfA [Candidatus Aceula lacicola]
MERMDRVNQMVKREVCNIVQREMEDPRLHLVSISRIEVSRDLKHAKVYFSVLGEEEKVEKAQDALNSARNLIRKRVAQRVRLKFIPEFDFYYDKSLGFNIELEKEVERLNNEH